MSKQGIRCSGCEHCREFRRDGNTRSSFLCKHPDYEYIENYFKEHRIEKMAGFIGFGKRWFHVPTIKTSPAWCPKKKEDGMNDGRKEN
ncbi:hypothetical protein MR857_13320 [bacterium]|nr:hypothetical protein [bacterium]MDY3022386.1 hypothetical protein [Oliverpabstia sp.]